MNKIYEKLNPSSPFRINKILSRKNNLKNIFK